MGMGAYAGMGAMSMFSASQQAEAQRAQGDYAVRQAEAQAEFAGMQSDDALKRGDRAASRYGQQVRGAIGGQRAALAAQGIDVNTGSAAASQEDIAAAGAEDMMTIRNNAWREAWGYRVQASQGLGQARMGQLGADNNARMTLLTGGIQAANWGLEGMRARNSAPSRRYGRDTGHEAEG